MFVAGQRARRLFHAFALVYIFVIHADLSWFESMIFNEGKRIDLSERV
jgi:hypothetical protein